MRVAGEKACITVLSSALFLVCSAYCLMVQTLACSYQLTIAAKRQETTKNFF